MTLVKTIPSSAEVPNNNSSKLYLPINFKPTGNDVMIGRGKKFYDHEGNENLRKIVVSQLGAYSSAGYDETAKSKILASVISSVRNANPIGRFIKHDPEMNRWYDVGDFLAKKKVSQKFRDLLNAPLLNVSALKSHQNKRGVEIQTNENSVLGNKRPCLENLQRSCSVEVPNKNSSKLYLPKNFKPNSNDVMIGRGKKFYDFEGNENLKKIVVSRLAEYSSAGYDKTVKSQILSSVISIVRNANPIGRFIKHDPEMNLWYDVGDILAREKVSQKFRDVQKTHQNKRGVEIQTNENSLLSNKSECMENDQQELNQNDMISMVLANPHRNELMSMVLANPHKSNSIMSRAILLNQFQLDKALLLDTQR